MIFDGRMNAEDAARALYNFVQQHFGAGEECWLWSPQQAEQPVVWISEGLEILEQVHPLIFGQLVPEGVAVVAQAEAGRIVEEVGLVGRALHGGELCVGQLVELPADLPCVVVLEVGRRGTREATGPGR